MACPTCGFRMPLSEQMRSNVESKKAFEFSCLDRKCGFRDFIFLDGFETLAGLEKPGKEARLGA